MTDPRTTAPAVDARMTRLLADMRPRLRAFLGNLARDEVDDLEQETLARAWRSRARLDEARGSGEAWLLRIAFRAFLDARRRPRLASTDGDEHLGPGGRDPLHLAAIREHTAALLDRLSPTERDVLLRFHRDGEPIERIAAALAMPSGTVRSHLHRARNRLWAIERERGEQR